MMQTVYLKINEIHPYKRNAKRHPRKQIEAIAASIAEFGWRQPVVVDATNTIVIGHARYEAARKLKLEEVPCLVASDLTEQQIKALRLADNQTATLGTIDQDLLSLEVSDILSDSDIDLSDFGFDLNLGIDVGESQDKPARETYNDVFDDLETRLHYRVFENFELMSFPITNEYGIPELERTSVFGTDLLRFSDKKKVPEKELSQKIIHFYEDDFKFISVWRHPDKYVSFFQKCKGVIAPDFSLYTDFPKAIQIMMHYRRQWCGAYWTQAGINVIPDVVWGDKSSWEFCFDGIPKHSVVATSSVACESNPDWNGKKDSLFRDGWNEMLRRLEPTKIIYYGHWEDLGGDVTRITPIHDQRVKGKK